MTNDSVGRAALASYHAAESLSDPPNPGTAPARDHTPRPPANRAVTRTQGSHTCWPPQTSNPARNILFGAGPHVLAGRPTPVQIGGSARGLPPHVDYTLLSISGRGCPCPSVRSCPRRRAWPVKAGARACRSPNRGHQPPVVTLCLIAAVSDRHLQARVYLLIRRVEDGFSADPLGVDAGHGGAGSVQFAGHALCSALVRPGRAVVHLVFDRNGANL